jgi:non-heme chloroperoxidase
MTPALQWSSPDGLALAGEAWGTPDGPLVILLHGGGQTRHSWRDTGLVLSAAGFRVVAYDARGHGDSDWSADGNYSQEAMVDDLKCIVGAEAAERPALVGASMGGTTSLIAMGERWVQGAALVLVDTAPRIAPEGLSKVRALMRSHPAGSWDPKRLAHDVDLHQRQARLEACAGALVAPTLLIRGGRSDVLSEAGAGHFLRLCRHSDYVEIPGAGHVVAADRSGVFHAVLVRFLTQHLGIAAA